MKERPRHEDETQVIPNYQEGRVSIPSPEARIQEDAYKRERAAETKFMIITIVALVCTVAVVALVCQGAVTIARIFGG